MTRRSVTYTDPETGEKNVLDDVYVEPAEYFPPEALKVAEEWDRKHQSDIKYTEALEVAKRHRPEVDTCSEREDAYIFSCSTDEVQDGGKSPVVVMKADGRVMNIVAYIGTKAGEPMSKDFDAPV